MNSNDWNLCRTWFYVAMQSAQIISVLLFVVTGVFIYKSLERVKTGGYTRKEKKLLGENKQRAMRQMMLMIVTMSVYMVYNFSYSLGIRMFSPGCTDVFRDHDGMNNLLWFASRGMSDYFWIYPFIYIFWPKAVKMEARKSTAQEGDGTPEVDYTVVEDESDDEIESIYPSGSRSLSHMRSLVRTLTYSVATPGSKRRLISARLSAANLPKSAEGDSDTEESHVAQQLSSGQMVGSPNDYPVQLQYS